MNDCMVAHAKAYPFAIPEGSYVLTPDGWRPLDGDPVLGARHAVIASGSNASPDRLMAKYADHAHLLEDTIPVTCAQLHDFDAVYSAHISHYGSIPATLAYVPGAIADVFVTWLTDAQLQRMHETEAVGVNYDFVKLTGINLLCGNEIGLTSAHAYLSKSGCLNKDGKPIPLAAFNVDGRQWRAMTQAEVLDYARSRLDPDEHTDTFIRRHIECADTRAQRTQCLAEDALHRHWAGTTYLTP
ncbi:MAG: hypothetical protein NUV50_05625 [Rhodospirillales bacterium]|nr:hypothetical protein [Rhodospirillales bacterium]